MCASLDDTVAAVALASLPAMTPVRLAALLERFGGPGPALAAVARGEASSALARRSRGDTPSTGGSGLSIRSRERDDRGGGDGDDGASASAIATRWAQAADVGRAAALVDRRATIAWIAGEDDYPIHDEVPLRPPILLGEGDRPCALRCPRVAIVGTRAATPHGLADARDLAASLTAAGITIVSGLAIGIDGAAHEGALDVAAGSTGVGTGTACVPAGTACAGTDLRVGQRCEPSGGVSYSPECSDGAPRRDCSTAVAGPVGVVATGLDVVYPRRHRALFDRVRRCGLIVGEVGYGVGPTAWRFPVRNRIIAALADVVVVVEATIAGGARITAEYAALYDRPVLAVPGSRRNPAAAGCNALIADGAHPLLDPSDVLVALGLVGSDVSGWAGRAPAELSTDARALSRAFGGEPATADQLAGRTGLSPELVSTALRELDRAGRVERNRGLLWPR